MPILNSKYRSPKFLFNGHIQTIYPYYVRRVYGISYQRERIYTPDNDFLDLDWLKKDNQRLVILNHGLEGSSDRFYMKGMAKALNESGWDVLAWNYRGCSGFTNRKYNSYHSGKTEDLEVVITHCLNQNRYKEIALTGFSLGGNLIMKYLGERNTLPKEITKAVAISAPTDLDATCRYINRGFSKVYEKRFLKTLFEKAINKSIVYPKQINAGVLKEVKTLWAYDDLVTAPINGFKDAKDYYEQASCGRYLENISIPALMINAFNDPFLAPECYPFNIAKKHKWFYLEVPKTGGHVGFYVRGKKPYWSEQRTVEFLNEG